MLEDPGILIASCVSRYALLFRATRIPATCKSREIAYDRRDAGWDEGARIFYHRSLQSTTDIIASGDASGILGVFVHTASRKEPQPILVRTGLGGHKYSVYSFLSPDNVLSRYFRLLTLAHFPNFLPRDLSCAAK